MIPDHLPGEPPVRRVPAAGVALLVVLGVPVHLVLGVALLPLWPVYLVLAAVYGRPPTISPPARYRYLLDRIARSPAPASTRAWVALAVVRAAITTPVRGLAWLVDEVIWGRALDAVEVRAPLFEVSGGRSGSTQLARHLEDDPRFVAPSLLQSLVPYRWVWVLARPTLGRLFDPPRLRALFERSLPPAFAERHEGDPSRTDTFDGVAYLPHLMHLGFQLDPALAADEFGAARLRPGTRGPWEDFVRALDRIGRKVLLDAAPGQRLFVKGHFLGAAPLLAERFPDASFLTVVRLPHERLRSAVNYLRVNPADPVLGPPTWDTLAQALLVTETEYNEVEQAWFTAPEGPRRCVVPFERFRRDLPGTLRHVYAALDLPPPADLPQAHPPRRRHGYQVDRTLAQLGIDEAALRARLAAYEAWARG